MQDIALKGSMGMGLEECGSIQPCQDQLEDLEDDAVASIHPRSQPPQS